MTDEQNFMKSQVKLNKNIVDFVDATNKSLKAIESTLQKLINFIEHQSK